MTKYIPYIIIAILLLLLILSNNKNLNDRITDRTEIELKKADSINKVLQFKIDVKNKQLQEIENKKIEIENKLYYEKSKVRRLTNQLSNISNRVYNRRFLDSLKSNVKFNPN